MLDVCVCVKMAINWPVFAVKIFFAFAKSLVSLKLSENDWWFEAQRHRTRKPFSAGHF
jgi:hypothetical protein